MPPFRMQQHDKEAGKIMDVPEGLIEQQIDDLLKPFDPFGKDALPDTIVKRDHDNQINLHHAYVRTRLNEIFSPLGWGEQDLELSEVVQGRERSGAMAVAYRARQRLIIRNPDGSIRTFFDGAGAWGIVREAREERTIWDLHSDCMNGARSVAFCRAAKSLGVQFGLSFYGDNPEAFRMRYCLPRDILRQQETEGGASEQLEMDPADT